jgi:hypothetical protein
VYKRPVCAKWSVSNEGTKLGMRCEGNNVFLWPEDLKTPLKTHTHRRDDLFSAGHIHQTF